MARTKFSTLGDFILHYGAAELARDLNQDPSTVSKWKTGTNVPRPDTAKAIQALACGRLTLDTILSGRA